MASLTAKLAHPTALLERSEIGLSPAWEGGRNRRQE